MKVSCEACDRLLLNVPAVEGENRKSNCRIWRRKCRVLRIFTN